ncbi:hypothetical protein KOW79_012726 [Hemibagrus wyckioides]|uniref:Uncharacterized protein n=1 Tax=Hemibagrus wyckioides TaxID=337641 RepID=A0A9D3NJQ5_9TELE|nr:hypothetical protein KOW79_012726 [Hemibagrus wyckioides]
MYPEANTDSPARLSTRHTGSPAMIYTARYGSPKRQLQFYSGESEVTRVGGQMFATHRSSLTELRVSHGGRRLSRQQSFPSEPLQVPKVGSGGRRSSSSSGRLLSLSFSESMRSEIDRYLSEQSLCPLRQDRSNHADLKGLREVRAAAQLKNLEDFLRSNDVSLQDCVAYHTGMKYR